MKFTKFSHIYKTSRCNIWWPMPAFPCLVRHFKHVHIEMLLLKTVKVAVHVSHIFIVEVTSDNRSICWFLGEVIAVTGSCETLGSWSHQKAVILHPDGNDG